MRRKGQVYSWKGMRDYQVFIYKFNYLFGEIWAYLKEHGIYSQCWMGKIDEGFIQYNIFL